MSDVVQQLWGFCHTLRHDGIDYGDYIEQLTYLLFLKMADERGIELPKGCDWQSLVSKSGTALQDHYIDLLRKLGQQLGLLVSCPGDFVSTDASPRIAISPAKWSRRFRVGANIFPQFAS